MKPIPSRLLGAACLALLSLLPCQADPIARIGTEEISPEKIRAYLDNLSPTDRSALEKQPALLNQAVRALILQQVLFKEAQSAGWEKQPEVLERLDRVRQGIVVESYLEAVTKVPEGYPTEAEVKAAFESKKDTLILPRQFQLAQIFVEQTGPDKASADKAKQRIDELSKKVRATGADFAAVARAESDETETAARGGEIGWLAESSLQPEIRSRVATLGKNAVSEPVRLDDGWYLVKVLDLKESRPATFEEVKPQLVQLLRNERARLNREAYLAKLQQQNPMAINELALAKLLQPANP